MPRFATVNNVSSYTRRAGGIGDLLSTATSQLGGIAPYHYWDFLNNRALFASADVGGVASTPGWSYTRADAQTAYAQDSAGNLIPFATGVLRRTDKGVLIEGARTNLCLQSQTFDNASWTKTRCSATANAITAPDGTLTADKIVEDSSNNTHFFGQSSLSLTSGTAVCASIFAKSGERSHFRFKLAAGFAVDPICRVDLGAGTVTTVQGSPTLTITALANGWYRIAMVATPNATTTCDMQVFMASDASTTSYQGDGTSGIFLWGAQLEAASFPSSYVPTQAASATRAADSLVVTGLTSITDHSWFSEVSDLANTTGSNARMLGTTTSGGTAVFWGASTNVGTFNGSVVLTKTGLSSIITGRTVKAASSFSASGRSITADGLSPATDANTWTMPTDLRFGNDAGTTSFLFGYIRRVAHFNSTINSAGLQAMTL